MFFFERMGCFKLTGCAIPPEFCLNVALSKNKKFNIPAYLIYLCNINQKNKSKMGIFNNLKNKLGIGGVKVELQIPGQLTKDSGVLNGKILLTSKSEQQVMSYKIKMIEEYTTGRGDQKKTKTFELGNASKPLDIVVMPGETKEVEFELPFNVLKSDNDRLKEMGGALGALGKLASFAGNEKSEFFVVADIDVKAAALDPSDKKEFRFV